MGNRGSLGQTIYLKPGSCGEAGSSLKKQDPAHLVTVTSAACARWYGYFFSVFHERSSRNLMAMGRGWCTPCLVMDGSACPDCWSLVTSLWRTCRGSNSSNLVVSFPERYSSLSTKTGELDRSFNSAENSRYMYIAFPVNTLWKITEALPRHTVLIRFTYFLIFAAAVLSPRNMTVKRSRNYR